MNRLKAHQNGAALVIGLIFLILLAIVGLSSIRGVTLQEKIIGNNVDSYRAQNNADVGLLTAEERLTTNGTNAKKFYLNTANDGVDYTDAALWAVCEDDTVNMDNLCEDLSQTPIIKAKYETTTVDDEFVVTVRAQGTARAMVMIQSTFLGRIKEEL